jgi:uncharacterized protein
MTSKVTKAIQKHTLLESLLYHLVPGVLIGAGYFLLAPLVQRAGYPSVMALILTAILILVPFEIGVLLWQGKRRSGKLTLTGVVRYRDPLPWHQYLLWVPVIFVASGVIITLLNPISEAMAAWFDWLPESMRLGMGLSGEFTRAKLVQTYALHFVFIIFVAPTVEEWYFRGFLLPRMPESLGWSGPLVHSLLFALYHVWSPWMLLARTLGLLPLIYIVRWKKNIGLGMVAHWLINSIDFFVGLGFIMSMG